MMEPSTVAPPLGGAWKKALGGLALATLLVLNVGALSPTPTDTSPTPTTSDASQAAEVTCVALEPFEGVATFTHRPIGFHRYDGPLTVNLSLIAAQPGSDEAVLQFLEPMSVARHDFVELEPVGEVKTARIERAREGPDFMIEHVEGDRLVVERIHHPMPAGRLPFALHEAREPKVIPCDDLPQPPAATPWQTAAPLPGEVACHLGLPHGGDPDLLVTATMAPSPSVGETTDA